MPKQTPVLPTATNSLDKLRRYVLHGGELPPKMLAKFNLLREMQALLVTGNSNQQAVISFSQLHGFSIQYCYKLIRECSQLFGDINQVDKNGLRNIQSERYTEIYQVAMQEGDYKAAVDALRRIDAINGLVNHKGERQYEALPLPTIINVVGDPKVLITNGIDNGCIPE